jgi:putative ABC transport system substrate-binding protein
MKKKVFGLALCAMLSALCSSAEAQQAKKIPRVGYLALRSGPSSHRDAFVQGLRDLGYVAGQTVAIEYRYADGNPERFPALAAELVKLNADVIVTASAAAVLALKEATRAIPIVFGAASDPVAANLVGSLKRPGGNVTGLSSFAPEAAGKRLGLFKESFSKVSRVAVLSDPTTILNTVEWTETQAASRPLGVDVFSLEVRRPNDLQAAFDSAVKERAGGLVVLTNPLTNNQRARVAELAVKRALPAIYNDRDFVEAGGLMSYGPELNDLYRRAAGYVDKILKGAKAGDLTVEPPTKFEFIVNLKAAKQIGVAIPPEVLKRAEQVIQ